MILVIGGIASGKRTYARSLGYADGQMEQAGAAPGAFDEPAAPEAPAVGAAFPVLYDAQELARAKELADPDAVAALAGELAKRDLVLFCDIGSGVVPLDPDERAWRERAGRLACQLAEHAEHVVRMVCGIPVQLK